MKTNAKIFWAYLNKGDIEGVSILDMVSIYSFVVGLMLLLG